MQVPAPLHPLDVFPARLHPLVVLPREVRALFPLHGGELHEVPPAGTVIGAFTRSQTGVVARRQLLAVGVSRRQIEGRLARGELVQRMRGVYAPGHTHLTLHGHRTAAALAIPGCFLSHGDGAALLGAAGVPSSRWNVTVPGDGGRRDTELVRVFTTTTLTDADIAVAHGLPCLSMARCIADAAAYATKRQMSNLLANAERAGMLHIAAVRDARERTRHRPTDGDAVLLAALTEHLRLGAQLSRSEVEAALRDIAVRAHLPPAQLNVMFNGDEIDAFWPDVRLAIEIDSWEFHSDRRSFVTDRAKLRRLTLGGLTAVPYAAADLVHRPGLVAAELVHLRARAALTSA